MGRKYTNPDASGYLLEAKACEKVTKELRRIAEKFQRAVDKASANRQTEFETAMQYTSEQQIQDDYGWVSFPKLNMTGIWSSFGRGRPRWSSTHRRKPSWL